MRYYGGKGVHGRKLSEMIINYLKSINKDPANLIWVEPFCGALGVTRHLASSFKEAHSNDICPDLIILMNSVQKKRFRNPQITYDRWKYLKNLQKPSAERAFAGFGCSFGGIWFRGYILEPNNNDMQYSSLIKISDMIKPITFHNLDYTSFLSKITESRSSKYVIYFDPPYAGTDGEPWEKRFDDFDQQLFWNTVKKYGKMKNVIVLVSEFKAPKEFKEIGSFPRKSGMHNTSHKQSYVEKLFTI